MNADVPGLEKIDSGRTCPICGKRLYEQRVWGGMVIPMMCECELARIKEENEDYSKRKFQSRVEENRRRSGFPSKQIKQTFDNFVERQGTRKALSISKIYAERFPNVTHGIIFIGSCGSGKTHLASAIGNEVLGKGYSVKFISAYEIYTAVLDSYRDFDGSEGAVTEPYKYSSLLIIDDIGTTPPTEKSKAVFHSIIEYRMNREKPTIFTSNLTLDELSDKLDARTIDRIPEGFKTILLQCASYRKIENRKRDDLKGG